ncbi:HNH endonuclease [Mollicutes bacterium LVI A0078]|nr:HNH endonuclease [Mollicutes bacterium LVI A0075]WOO91445.1 HNH endonuclease [Mollicutes bacterium LVI A0078]
MSYLMVEQQILNMKCQKIYKPILLLSYIDYLEIMHHNTTNYNYRVNLESLLPIIKYYLESDLIRKSHYGLQNIATADSKEIFGIIVNGPLFRIQSEVSIFSAYEVNNSFTFGFATDNESINVKQLCTSIRKACNKLINQLLGNDLEPLQLALYQEMVNEIKTTKIDLKGHPKIYKYLVILSYIDYFTDLSTLEGCFKIQVPVEELFIYYKLYFNIPEFGDNIKSPEVKDGSDKYILNHMKAMPIRKLCKPNTFFECTQIDNKSRKVENLPTKFGIIIDDTSLNIDIMIQIIRGCVLNVIQLRTNKIINTNLVMDIKYSTEDIPHTVNEQEKVTTPARYGQSQYRKSLIEKYNCTCALCNMDLDFVLIASHAMPWRDCTSTHQRLSPNNGLLLCEYHDSLFDKGLITFDTNSNYEVIFSEHMTQISIDHFYNEYENKIPNYVLQSPRLKTYLEYHKNNIFKI